jgi:hypothetical protein
LEIGQIRTIAFRDRRAGFACAAHDQRISGLSLHWPEDKIFDPLRDGILLGRRFSLLVGQCARGSQESVKNFAKPVPEINTSPCGGLDVP